MQAETDPRLFVRDATPEEKVAIFPGRPHYETWVGVLDRGGVVVGHICLSRQEEVLGHDTENSSDDPNGAILLWRAAKKKAKEWGAKDVYIHIEADTPGRIVEFWRTRGAKPIFVMFKLTLGLTLLAPQIFIMHAYR